MSVLILSLLLAFVVWGFIALTHGSVPLSVALFLAATACVPGEFVGIDAGGLTLTVDRLWFVAMCCQVLLFWYQGKVSQFRLEGTDVLLAMFLLWLIVRTISQPLGSAVAGQPDTLMHLINGYLVPVSIYWMLRTQTLSMRQLKPAVVVMMLLGVYLSITAIFEKAGLWSFVYPRFIADPTLGIHFGRARGPMLQSVRLGVCLNACLACVIMGVVWVKPFSKARWILAVAFVPLCCAAILATLTRSIWMSLGVVMVVVIAFCLRGISRRAALAGLATAAILVVAIKGPNLVAFKREYSEEETRESTYMRGAFAYVSWKMINDRPITGFGFNQFQVHNLPYLADRSTNIRLESIRGYVHHNSFLSLLVDLGMVGFSIYTLTFLALLRRTWALWSSVHAEKWARSIALCAMTIAGVHLIQMAFHEVSFSSIENTLVFAAFGLVAAAHRQFCSSRILVPVA